MMDIRRRPEIAALDPEDLSRDEARRAAKADRKVASGDRTAAAAGLRDLQDIERRHGERLEAQSLAARLAQTSSLALARGEEVRTETVRLASPMLDEHGASVVRDGAPVYRRETHTRVRIASRSGLQLAFERGDLDGGTMSGERLHETAKLYRRAFETASALSTPARNLAPISGRAPLRASAGPQDAVFAAGEILRRLRSGLDRRQIVVLDQVCGMDLTVRATANALRADVRTIRRVLVTALTSATEVRSLGSPSR
ncbi:MAG TPA: hypothetical protein VFE13_16600 [Caulobacteraceae bacterium]|jgi:hypothetical protein|nr:hypothetical protein [Caulobacteraceae bacterium]